MQSADFTDAYSGFQIGAPPKQIELIFALSGGLSFEEAWQHGEEGFVADGVPVRVLSPEHFIENKTAAGRLQDLADADAVRKARNISK